MQLSFDDMNKPPVWTPNIGDWVMTPEGWGKVEQLTLSDDPTNEYDETVVAVRHKSYSWRWYLMSAISPNDGTCPEKYQD